MPEAKPARPTIAISMGDPGGIGPEVLVKALAERDRRTSARFLVLGSAQPMQDAAERAGIAPFWWQTPADAGINVSMSHDVVILDRGGDNFPHATDRNNGEHGYQSVIDAIRLCNTGQAQALVTAPISKEAWKLAGKGRYAGHTELLRDLFKAKRVGMLFESPKLRVILATVHIPLMDVRNVLTIGKVFDAIDLGNDACKDLGVREPRIAVCGLNPHAGEHGLLGDEETRLIEPAIEHARRVGIDAAGPFPADTIFNRAVAGRYDLVVAMYHDQGLIPVKLLAWDSAVNVTCGLPVWRTSPDHGTAFDIAGKNRANEGSMAAAIDLAVRLAT
ncbi:MAG TPA: 4-hydroxythreonine-4-phosphate dehydrogenase PdxA [Phycisphaerales bacterium]|nr:4-hydroxythreonine-4-phosphate dehydrogenase PdxA [Phycisphaerales bacterium]